MKLKHGRWYDVDLRSESTEALIFTLNPVSYQCYAARARCAPVVPIRGELASQRAAKTDRRTHRNPAFAKHKYSCRKRPSEGCVQSKEEISCSGRCIPEVGKSSMGCHEAYNMLYLSPIKGIDVWLASLTCASCWSGFVSWKEVLSKEECERARRFVFDSDRRRFVRGHFLLRSILGNYLQQDPRTIKYCCSKGEKPTLGHDVLKFNMSHSGEYALYVVAKEREVGVDIEQIRPIDDFLQLAERFFTASESRTLRSFPLGRQLEAFLHCWCRKEALLKATGKGLALALDSVEVSIYGEGRLRQISVECAPGLVTCWQVMSLPPVPGFVSALAVEGKLAKPSTGVSANLQPSPSWQPAEWLF